MARLSEEGPWLLQQIGGEVVLFHAHTGEELVRFNPADANQAARKQKDIHELTQLSGEEKSFAHFWSGYFYAYATVRVY